MEIYIGTWRRQNCGTWNFSWNTVSDSEWIEDSRKGGCDMLFIVVQLPSHVQLFATPRTAARQTSLSLTISQSLPKFMTIALVMSSNHLILFSFCLLSFPASGSFPMSQLITWPKYWSVLAIGSLVPQTSLYIWKFSVHVL